MYAWRFQIEATAGLRWMGGRPVDEQFDIFCIDYYNHNGRNAKEMTSKVKIQYIKNDTERSKTLSVRRKTLFKKVKSKNLFYNLLNLNYEKSKLG